MLGLHLPVMKLCLASVSCVIENRLESEDNELERRLLRGRRSSSLSSSSRTDGESAPSGGRPPAAPAPFLSAAAAATTMPVARSATSGPNRPATPAPPRDDLPLSHTWHGGEGAPNTAAGANADDEASGGGGTAGGGNAGRFGAQIGSRTNLLKGTRRWGTNRGSRVLDGDGLHAVGEDAPAGAPTGAGTPTKSVKFILGRKRTENNGFSSAAAAAETAAAAPGGKFGAARAGGTSSKPAAEGAGKAAGGQSADPRAAVMNVTVQTRLWAEYFNNTLRCWEALLDPFR